MGHRIGRVPGRRSKAVPRARTAHRAPPGPLRQAASSSLITVSVSPLQSGPASSDREHSTADLAIPGRRQRRRRRRQTNTPPLAAATPPPRAAGGAAATALAACSPACWKVFGMGRSPIRESGQMITNARPTTALVGMVPPPRVADPVTGVVGVRPVVAHHPEPARRHGDVEPDLGRRRPRVDVGLLAQRDAVDRDLALGVAADDVVAGHADDALDVVGTRAGDADQAGHVVPDPRQRVARRRRRRVPGPVTR